MELELGELFYDGKIVQFLQQIVGEFGVRLIFEVLLIKFMEVYRLNFGVGFLRFLDIYIDIFIDIRRGYIQIDRDIYRCLQIDRYIERYRYIDIYILMGVDIKYIDIFISVYRYIY